MTSQSDIHPITRRVNELVDAAVAAGQTDLDQSIETLMAAWQLIPEPKHEWPDADRVLSNLAGAYRLKGDLDKAVEFYRSTLRTPHGNRTSTVHLWLGRILLDRGETDAAREHLKKAWDLSEGRVFSSIPKKYRDFAKGKPKLH
jgi:tetratricopeptide (TPR) repeat protein